MSTFLCPSGVKKCLVQTSLGLSRVLKISTTGQSFPSRKEVHVVVTIPDPTRNKKHEKENEELFDILLRVLCNLTVPEETLFNGELPEEKTTRNFYILLQTYRRRYKEAFVDEAVWNVLSTKLGDLLRKEDRRSANTQFYYVDFSQSRTRGKKRVFNKRKIKV